MLLFEQLTPKGNRDMRNVTAGLEENIRKKYFAVVIHKDNIFSDYCLYLFVKFDMHRFINTNIYANYTSDIKSLSVLMLGKYGVCVLHLSSCYKQTPAVTCLVLK